MIGNIDIKQPNIITNSSGSGSWDQYSGTIVGGILIAANPGVYCVTPEGGIADNLVTITGGSVDDEIVLYPVDSVNTITVKHGTGNIQIGFDFTLNSIYDQLRLIKHADGNWVGGGINDNA